ncbi:MAG TPA: pitrilysin family protein [bacterium]|nr:pitrilysin family protein [bacterium]
MLQPHRELLPNGATLLLVETHQAPVVSLNICVRVGSRFETDEEAGICHLIEHMLFKGTDKMGAGEVAKRIEASGGEVNAYTSFDETVYYCTMASRHFATGLEVLSDAVLHSVFDPEELAREKEVVIEEILRSKDSPGKVLSEALFQKAFSKHTYGRPIIGFKETVQGFSREKILDFYRSWYVPENMVVVVTGDFESDKTLDLLRRTFGALPSRPSPKVHIHDEPEQCDPRAVALTNPIQGSTMMIGFHVPGLEHADIPALDVLSHILGEGESSRLDLNVKERRGLVNSIYSYVYAPHDPGLFTVGFTLPEKNFVKATEAVLEEIYRFHDRKIDQEELNMAKLNIKSDAVYEKETVEGLGRKYGYFETILGRHDFDDHYYQEIDAVTADDVREVAARYLKPERLNIGLIHPQDSKKKVEPKDLIAWSKLKAKPAAKRRAAADVEPQFLRLKNGLRLILKENHNVPTVVIRSAHLGGLRSENPRSNGIHGFLAQLWGKSTESLNAEAMAREVESIAGTIQAYSGRNVVGMKADFLSEKSRDGVDLFLDALLHPRFDKDEMERERANILEAIRREGDQLAGLAFKHFQQKLFPSHPYGLSLLGTAANVRRFGRSDLKKAFDASLNPKNSVISVVGDFDCHKMAECLKPALESIKPRKAAWKPPRMDPPPRESLKVETVKDKLQAHIVLGFRGASYADKDRYALDVLNNILSGQGGRLFIELRDKLSLAYSVTSLSQEGIEPGYFGVYIATEPRKVPTAVEGILKELEKVTREPVGQEEMDRAKQYMVGAYEIDLQRNSTVATQLAFNEIYGIDRREWIRLPEKVLKVTPEAVLKVARKILKLDRYVLSIVRP